MNCLNGSESFALDSSVLLFDYFCGGSQRVRPVLKEGLLNDVTIAETLYVICRTDGEENAANYVEKCARTVRAIAPSEKLSRLAGSMKCKFSISLADCWVLATGIVFKVPCLFGFREAELVKNLGAISDHVEVKFLDELAPS